MNNDNDSNLHSMTKLLGWLCYWWHLSSDWSINYIELYIPETFKICNQQESAKVNLNCA